MHMIAGPSPRWIRMLSNRPWLMCVQCTSAGLIKGMAWIFIIPKPCFVRIVRVIEYVMEQCNLSLVVNKGMREIHSESWPWWWIGWIILATAQNWYIFICKFGNKRIHSSLICSKNMSAVAVWFVNQGSALIRHVCRYGNIHSAVLTLNIEWPENFFFCDRVYLCYGATIM